MGTKTVSDCAFTLYEVNSNTFKLWNKVILNESVWNTSPNLFMVPGLSAAVFRGKCTLIRKTGHCRGKQ